MKKKQKRFSSNYPHGSRFECKKYTKPLGKQESSELPDEQVLRSAALKIRACVLAHPTDQELQVQYGTFVLHVLNWCDRMGATPDWVHALVGNESLSNSR